MVYSMIYTAKIERYDDQGRGITYYNNKIVFVYGAIVNEKVKIYIFKERKKYYLAKVIEVIEISDRRVDSKCPYFNKCGGCNLLHLSYYDSLEFKKDKISKIFSRYLEMDLKNIEALNNPTPFFYRNKISLKVKNGEYGFYEYDSINLIKIDSCLVAKESINNLLKDIECLNVNDGKVVIRSNKEDELLISIETLEKIKPNIKKLDKNNKIKGVILNGKRIFGEENFIEKIGDYSFQINYNSFFQINSLINEKLFELIEKNIDCFDVVLDLYCGVGTLGIVASKKARYVYGIEIEESSIKNAKYNKELNNISNIEFKKMNASNLNTDFNEKITKIIVDPPRNGLDKKTIDKIIEINPNSIIYISCDPLTLVRDLKKLREYYDIQKYYLIDMFSYTYHIESFVILNKKTCKI